MCESENSSTTKLDLHRSRNGVRIASPFRSRSSLVSSSLLFPWIHSPGGKTQSKGQLSW